MRGRGISGSMLATLLGGTAGTFAAFMIFDPEPDLLLASSTAANVTLILWMIFRLYAWDLLLSPMASVVIGPVMILYYSLGNLGARIAGEGRVVSNPGSLEFYPLAALLSTIGLGLFLWIVFFLCRQQTRYVRISYRDLHWRPWQGLAAGLLVVGQLTYLSLKYPFVGGYFREVEGQVDRWLAASVYFFVTLSVIIGVSITLRGRGPVDRLVGLASIALPIVTAVGLRSRTFMGTVALTLALCWITLRPQRARAVFVVGTVVTAVLVSAGTVVKGASVRGLTHSVMDNLIAVRETDLHRFVEENRRSLSVDTEYRLAGFEMPAAVLRAQSVGAAPMYGEGVVGGLMSALPNLLRPRGEFSERIAIFDSFRRYGLDQGDSIGLPLTSGVADWGAVAGPLIYVLIAAYCLATWRVVQQSPRLFVAYLMVGATPGDVFWDDALFAIRGIGFAWLVLLISGPLLTPRWVPERRHARHTMPVRPDPAGFLRRPGGA